MCLRRLIVMGGVATALALQTVGAGVRAGPALAPETVDAGVRAGPVLAPETVDAGVRAGLALAPGRAMAGPGSPAAQDAGGAAPAEAADTADHLVELLQVPGVSGYEDAVRQWIAARLPEWAEPQVDEIGNLRVTVGSGSPHLLVAATLDEVGYVVSEITRDGYLRLHPPAGSLHPLFHQFHYGRPVTIQTADLRLVPGVAATMSTHIASDLPPGSRSAPRGLEDLWIDVGAESRAQVQALGVRLMDPLTLRERGQRLHGDRVAGGSAQARAGALALLAVAAGQPAAPDVAGTVTLAWTGQSAARFRGLQRLSRSLQADRVVVLSRTTRVGGRGGGGDSVDPLGQSGRLGAGPLVADGDAWLRQQADGPGVEVQDATDLAGPDGGDLGREELPVHLLSVPVRHAGSPVETVVATDVDAAARLIAALAGLAPPPDRLALPPAGEETEPAGESAGQEGADDETAGAAGAGAPATDPRPMAADTMPSAFPTLERFIETYGVSGHEDQVRRLVESLLPDWAEPEVDTAGNLTVSVGDGVRHLLFIAHMDEVGYEVTAIGDDGSLELRNRGGFLAAVYEASLALVHTATGRVPAILTPRPGYLEADAMAPPRDAVRADPGTGSRAATEALGIAVGDTVTIRKRFQPLAGSRATGRSVDDRVGSTAILLALQRLDPAALGDRRVTFAWSVEEETGLVGAGIIAERTRPNVVFAVDTFVSSDSPVDARRRAHVPLGSGVVARAVDGNHVSPRATVTRVLEIAARHGVPIVPSTTGGGTDAGAFVEWGAVPMPISWPARYSHSPVELIDGRDVDALVDLVVALAYEF